MNEKVLQSVLSGKSDKNISFSDFQNLIVDLGFKYKRQKGSHIIYYHIGINELMNIQPDGSKAKDYEVRQLRRYIIKYNLSGGL